MFLFRPAFLIVALVALAGCSQATDLMATMRNDRPALTDEIRFGQPIETEVTREAIALEERVREVIFATTRPGVGRCTGTGLGDPALGGCDEASLKGRWIGRLSPAGPVDVATITPGIAAVHAQMGHVTEATHRLLEAQRDELAEMQAAQEAGTLDAQTVQARRAEMRQARLAVADALSLAAQRSGKACLKLEQLRDKGQADLDFHIEAMRHIERRAVETAEALRQG